MTCEPIEQYLDSILRRQLEAFGTDAAFLDRIIGTIREQMLSAIYHWNDEAFRRALLIIGSEEGVFYKPHADDDLRNLVVVTIRNSEIECLQSENFPVAGLSCRLGDADVKAITSAAIEFFSKVDFSGTQQEMEPPINDKYLDLSRKHPISWGALTAISDTKKQIIDYDSVASRAKPSLAGLPVVLATKRIGHRSDAMQIAAAIVGDGFSFSVDPQLKSMLEYCIENEQPFLVDSFKGLSRNIEKLLMITEHLLGHDTCFVTSNYFLANGHTERRMKLLRAGRSFDDGFRNWKQTAGLGPWHKAVLSAATKA